MLRLAMQDRWRLVMGTAFFLVASSCSTGNDFQALTAELQERAIPVEAITLQESTVAAKLHYREGAVLTEEKLQSDLDSVFQVLGEEFPKSSIVRIEIYREGELLLPLEGTTSGILARVAQADGGAGEVDDASADRVETRVGERRSATVTLHHGVVTWVLCGVIGFYGFVTLLAVSLWISRKRDRQSELVTVEEMRGHLKIVCKDGTTLSFAITEPTTIIGRDESCTIVLDDQHVSRRHAEIRLSGRGYHLLDLGGTNGTRVNGCKVDEHWLQPGDRISVGKTKLLFNPDE